MGDLVFMTAKVLLLVSFSLLYSCSNQSQSTISLDEAAEQYVKLGLELGEYDANYIDSYVGPKNWREHAQKHLRSEQALADAITELLASVEAIVPSSNEEKVRRHMLLGKVRAMDTRARMGNGEEFTFAKEAELLFDANPGPADFDEFDGVLAEIDKVVPGEGNLNQRVNALRMSVTVPEDKLDSVFRRAIEECRQRTLDHIELPQGERFKLEYVSGVSWGGYLEYLGDYESMMSINTDVPMTLDGAVHLGCHEGYPGHHVYNLLVDQRYLQDLGWVEFQLQPLYAPAMLIHEGSAEYAVKLAFPNDESLAFQRDVLAPLAGIEAANVATWNKYLELASRLGDHAASATAQRYLDGEITRDEAVQERIKYGIRTPEEAERNVRFVEGFGAYVLNYSLGEQIVSNYIESQSNDEYEKWEAFQKLIRELPSASDLTNPE
jgi:hypothetical protein